MLALKLLPKAGGLTRTQKWLLWKTMATHMFHQKSTLMDYPMHGWCYGGFKFAKHDCTLIFAMIIDISSQLVTTSSSSGGEPMGRWVPYRVAGRQALTGVKVIEGRGEGILIVQCTCRSLAELEIIVRHWVAFRSKCYLLGWQQSNQVTFCLYGMDPNHN